MRDQEPDGFALTDAEVVALIDIRMVEEVVDFVNVVADVAETLANLGMLDEAHRLRDALFTLELAGLIQEDGDDDAVS